MVLLCLKTILIHHKNKQFELTKVTDKRKESFNQQKLTKSRDTVQNWSKQI